MLNAVIIALCVGGATMLGSVFGYIVRYRNALMEGAVYSVAAGIMMTASFCELIIPAVNDAQGWMYYFCIAGIPVGGCLIVFLQQLLARYETGFRNKLLSHTNGVTKESPSGEEVNSALLFIVAIAAHNFPEGAAAGVGLAAGDLAKALKIAAGIALQNIPEGMIVLLPLIRININRKKALAVGILTGMIEIAGTFIGYFTASAVSAILPLSLCLTGGAMLYIVCSDVIEDAKRMAGTRVSVFSLLLGCCFMLLMEKAF